MESQAYKKPFFQNLDGLRFIAFLGVFASHIFIVDQSIEESSLFVIMGRVFTNSQWGDLGLYLFFIMSGFLITFLLLKEHESFGKVGVGYFYMRRVLRIWPLYYLLVFFALWGSTAKSDMAITPLAQWSYLFFFNNLLVAANGFDFSGVMHLWAVSVEEQFYFILPLAIGIFPVRKLWLFFVGIILMSLSFRIVHHDNANMLYYHSLSAAFDIALGGLAAWIMYYNVQAREWLSNTPKPVIVVIYTLGLLGTLFYHDIFPKSLLVLSLLIFQLFALFIVLEQNYAKHSVFKLHQFRVLSHLGRYAFGCYCFHIYCTRVCWFVASYFGVFSEPTGQLLVLPLLSLLFTLVVSIISYHLFEVFFLNMKKRYMHLT